MLVCLLAAGLSGAEVSAETTPTHDIDNPKQADIPIEGNFIPGFQYPSSTLHKTLRPQLNDQINEPHPFPDYMKKFIHDGKFPDYYRHLINIEPVDRVQSKVFDEAEFRKIKRIYVQMFENKTAQPHRDESAGKVVAAQAYRELRNTNRFTVHSFPLSQDEAYRMELSTEPGAKRGAASSAANAESAPDVLKELQVTRPDVDAIMIGAVTKYIDHYTDNDGNLRQSISSGVEFGSFLVSVSSGKVIWGARFVGSQAPNLREFVQGSGRWLNKEEFSQLAVKNVMKVFQQEQGAPVGGAGNQ